MATDKKAMFCVFKMDKASFDTKGWNLAKWRETMSGDFKLMWDRPKIFFKAWWVNMEKREWGALYIWDSEKDMKDYIASDFWQKTVQDAWGKVDVTILDIGCILARKTSTSGKDSWMTP